MTNRVDITIRQGETWAEAFTLRDSATGDLLPVTGYTGTMTLWDDQGNVLCTAPLVITQDPGIVSYTLSATQTAALPYYPTFVHYDIQYTRADSTVDYFQEGTAYIEQRP